MDAVGSTKRAVRWFVMGSEPRFYKVPDGPDIYYKDIEPVLQAHRNKPPDADNLELADKTLDTMLGRVLDSKQRLESKSALVVPAIGTIGALAADRAPTNLTGLPLVLGGLAVACAVIAILYAVSSVVAQNHRGGPGAAFVALATGRDRLVYEQEVVDSLALAVLDTGRIVAIKANLFNRSLAWATLGVVLLLAFIVLGGWS